MVKGKSTQGWSQSASVDVTKALHTMDPQALLSTCDQAVRERGYLLLLGLAVFGFGLVRVVAGRRTLERQSELYGQGRSRSELRAAGVDDKYADTGLQKVTWCKPQYSKHVSGHAFDLDFRAYPTVPVAMIRILTKIIRLNWGGDWTVRDYGHFELG